MSEPATPHEPRTGAAPTAYLLRHAVHYYDRAQAASEAGHEREAELLREVAQGFRQAADEWEAGAC